MKNEAVERNTSTLLSPAERQRLLAEAEARDRGIEASRRRRNAAPALQGLDDKALERLHLASREVLYGALDETGAGGLANLPNWHGGASLGEPLSGDSASSKRSFRNRRRRATAATAEEIEAGVAEVWLEVPEGLDAEALLEAMRTALPDLEGRFDGRVLGRIEEEAFEQVGVPVGLQEAESIDFRGRTLGGGGGGGGG
jgi:hypothetical protein